MSNSDEWEVETVPGEAGPPGRVRRVLRGFRRWLLRGAVVAAALAALLLLGLVIWLNLAPDRGPDVLLITIDTQRTDGLGCYGGPAGQSPNIDRLAERGVLFERTVVSIPRTTQNLTTLLTGLEPRDHGVRELYDHLPDDVTTLAERLRAAGYRTAAFVGGGPLGVDQNLYQGFEYVHAHTYEQQARAFPEVLTASAWITRNAAGPWFVWLQLYDPHFYYAPPWPFWDRDDPEMPAIRELYERLGSGRGSFGALHYQNDLEEGRRRALVGLYHGETRSVDFAIGWLLRLVGLYELLDPGRSTLVVVTADHGEGLGEHGCYYNHGAYLYDEDLLVPLVLSLPDALPENERVPFQVRTVDIYPTVLELVGQVAQADVAGRSLLPLIHGEETADRLAFSESDTNRHPQNPRFHFEDGLRGRWRSVRDGRHKLIRIPHPDGDRFELYDVQTDPGETRNLVGDEPDTFDRLADLLARWEADGELPGRRPRPELSPDALEERLQRLRSLGYVD